MRWMVVDEMDGLGMRWMMYKGPSLGWPQTILGTVQLTYLIGRSFPAATSQ